MGLGFLGLVLWFTMAIAVLLWSLFDHAGGAVEHDACICLEFSFFKYVNVFKGEEYKCVNWW